MGFYSNSSGNIHTIKSFKFCCKHNAYEVETCGKYVETEKSNFSSNNKDNIMNKLLRKHFFLFAFSTTMYPEKTNTDHTINFWGHIFVSIFPFHFSSQIKFNSVFCLTLMYLTLLRPHRVISFFPHTDQWNEEEKAHSVLIYGGQLKAYF